MANLNRTYKRVVAIGCTHGGYLSLPIAKQVVQFAKDFKADIRIHLGDLADTAAFRRGSKGTKDQLDDVRRDQRAALDFAQQYEPTHLTWGNHDWRLMEHAEDPDGRVKFAAQECWNKLAGTVRELHCKTTDYDMDKNWFEIGGTFWGHGFWYNMTAVRDTAEFLGGPVVMAHLHRPYEESGRTRKRSRSFCVGMLADGREMTYARRRRASSQWGHGLVFGEVSGNEAHLWLAQSDLGKPLHLPPFSL